MQVIKTISQKSDFFPEQLGATDPEVERLFYLGEPSLLQTEVISIVGSRKITSYGRRCIEKVVPQLVSYGATVASGLALGCDAYAQRTALDAGGKVIAVLPGPLEEIYPRSNISIAKGILEQGGLIVSEYSKGTPILKKNFLERNRIVSGVASGLLVIEAAARSGTLSTINHALKQGTEVMAIPGDVDRASSAGTNGAISAGAHLVTSADDVLACMGWSSDRKRTSLPTGENEIQQQILNMIAEGAGKFDQLQQKTNVDPSQLGSELTMLEISGKIFTTGDNMWYIK